MSSLVPRVFSFSGKQKDTGDEVCFSSDTKKFSTLDALAKVREYGGHHCLSVLALYWKDRIGNQKSGTGIEDRGPVIGDR